MIFLGDILRGTRKHETGNGNDGSEMLKETPTFVATRVHSCNSSSCRFYQAERLNVCFVRIVFTGPPTR
jgi:hypothetical protein